MKLLRDYLAKKFVQRTDIHWYIPEIELFVRIGEDRVEATQHINGVYSYSSWEGEWDECSIINSLEQKRINHHQLWPPLDMYK